jgi:hypothetical protein
MLKFGMHIYVTHSVLGLRNRRHQEHHYDVCCRCYGTKMDAVIDDSDKQHDWFGKWKCYGIEHYRIQACELCTSGPGD